MSWRTATALALLAVSVGACASPSASRSSDSPRTRCLTQPGRGESYPSDRPLLFLF